jgi:hypothetical protein
MRSISNELAHCKCWIICRETEARRWCKRPRTGSGWRGLTTDGSSARRISGDPISADFQKARGRNCLSLYPSQSKQTKRVRNASLKNGFAWLIGGEVEKRSVFRYGSKPTGSTVLRTRHSPSERRPFRLRTRLRRTGTGLIRPSSSPFQGCTSCSLSRFARLDFVLIPLRSLPQSRKRP